MGTNALHIQTVTLRKESSTKSKRNIDAIVFKLCDMGNRVWKVHSCIVEAIYPSTSVNNNLSSKPLRDFIDYPHSRRMISFVYFCFLISVIPRIVLSQLIDSDALNECMHFSVVGKCDRFQGKCATICARGPIKGLSKIKPLTTKLETENSLANLPSLFHHSIYL